VLRAIGARCNRTTRPHSVFRGKEGVARKENVCLECRCAEHCTRRECDREKIATESVRIAEQVLCQRRSRKCLCVTSFHAKYVSKFSVGISQKFGANCDMSIHWSSL